MSTQTIDTLATIAVLLNFGAAFQAIFLAFRLWSRPGQERKANRLLSLLLIVFIINILNTVIIFTGHAEILYFFQDFSNASLLLIGPTLYFYFASITRQHRLGRRDLWHYTPPIAYSVALLAYYLFDVFSPAVHEGIHNFMFLIFNVQIVTYFVFSFRLLNRHQQHIVDQLSTLESVSFHWAKNTLVAFAIIYVLVISTALYEGLVGPVPAIIRLNYVLIWSFQVNYLSWKSLHLPPPAFQQIEVASSQPKLQLDRAQAQDIIGKAEALLNTDPQYTNPNFTLNDLSKLLDISPRYLSAAINQERKLTFYQFVNAFRVDMVKKRLSDPSSTNITLMGLASECGFQSSSTFNTAFKKATGVKPSEYRKQITEIARTA